VSTRSDFYRVKALGAGIRRVKREELTKFMQIINNK
jgi:hypothetical protein